jgi:hypothetical protein
MIASNVQPMTLGNMRANGVRSLLVYCFACHHEAILPVEHYPDDLPVPYFSPRMEPSSQTPRDARQEAMGGDHGGWDSPSRV